MKVGSAYTWMKPRLEAVSERSQDLEFKAEAARAIETFEAVKALDERPYSCLGLTKGDDAAGHQVQVSGVARLWDLSDDRVHFRLQDPGRFGLGASLTSYVYNQTAGMVFVEQHRDVEESMLSVFFGPREMEQSYVLDLVSGKVLDRTDWKETVIPGG